MDTSVQARLVMIGVIFAAVWVMVYANARMAYVSLVRKKRACRIARIAWPALALLFVFSIVDAFYIEPHWIRLTRHQIATSKLDGGSRVRIVHLTDLHLDRFGKRERAMIRLTNRAEPDIIVLTGDYLNVHTAETEAALERIGGRLSEIAPTYAVEGNWDHSQTMNVLRRAGVNILDGWTVVSGERGARIALGQVSWLAERVYIPHPKDVESLYKVVLCHMPRAFDSADESGMDLMLVGHTHGGQIRLPIFGALMPDRTLVGKYQSGLYSRGGTLLYVNRGVGMEGGAAPRVRFCCPPEIAVFDVRSPTDD